MISKEYVQGAQGLVARVTFVLPNSVWADRICLMGDFNDWDRDSHPLQRDHQGQWWLTVDLEPGRDYQFRYLCDGDRWMNDTEADAFHPNPHGSDNFVVNTAPPF